MKYYSYYIILYELKIFLRKSCPYQKITKSPPPSQYESILRHSHDAIP